MRVKLSIEYLIFVLVLLILFLGGFKAQDIWFSWITSMVFSALLVIEYLKNKKIHIPKNFTMYLLFLVFCLISLTWSKNFQVSFRYLFMFLSGGLIWLHTYNYRNNKVKYNLSLIIILLGIVFGSWSILNEITGSSWINSFSLNRWAAESKNHHHVGDLWAVIGVVIVGGFFSKTLNKLQFILLLFLTIFFLLTSQSRSAILSFGAGFFYLIYKNKSKIIQRKILLGFISILLILLFLYTTLNKSLLLSRPYFIQAILGIYDNPTGVGVGNFYIITKNPKYQYFDTSNFSSVTHNIILEVLVGLGVLALPYADWFARSLVEVLKNKKEKGTLYGAIFLALTVNFFFDFTYFIPAMYFLWMASLGEFQKLTAKS